MSTGKQIRTALGMIISGFGAKAGQGNLAYDMLQNNINRDIDSQKANLGKQQNLLTFAYKKYGNLNDATNMVRAPTASTGKQVFATVLFCTMTAWKS